MTAFDTFLKALSQATTLEGVLGDEHLEYPPNEAVDYWATPQNAVVFGWMGVDGVHYAILKIDGGICVDSPVLQISPMDFDEPCSLLAPTFADYLAIGCSCDRRKIEELLTAENLGQAVLLAFLRAHFRQSRFWNDDVNREITPYQRLMIPKPDVG